MPTVTIDARDLRDMNETINKLSTAVNTKLLKRNWVTMKEFLSFTGYNRQKVYRMRDAILEEHGELLMRKRKAEGVQVSLEIYKKHYQ